MPFSFQVDVTELCPSASVLAQQLTHVELERLSYIGPEEFVQAFAKVSAVFGSKGVSGNLWRRLRTGAKTYGARMPLPPQLPIRGKVFS